MDLLIIPVMLAIGGFLFTQVQSTNEQYIAADNQREETLQTYLDQMTQLLLEQGLRRSEPGAEIREVTRVRTLTALRRLDSDRRSILLQFLHDTELIGLESDSIIDFTHADLSRVDLSLTGFGSVNLNQAFLYRTNLNGASLQGARLIGTRLIGTNLMDANLMDANLQGARVTQEQLSQATSLRGAILPDGTKVPDDQDFPPGWK